MLKVFARAMGSLDMQVSDVNKRGNNLRLIDKDPKKIWIPKHVIIHVVDLLYGKKPKTKLVP